MEVDQLKLSTESLCEVMFYNIFVTVIVTVMITLTLLEQIIVIRQIKCISGSTSFCTSNGVKQGGIISPVTFKVYKDDLSCTLNHSNIGGRFGYETVNHLSYI